MNADCANQSDKDCGRGIQTELEVLEGSFAHLLSQNGFVDKSHLFFNESIGVAKSSDR